MHRDEEGLFGAANAGVDNSETVMMFGKLVEISTSGTRELLGTPGDAI